MRKLFIAFVLFTALPATAQLTFQLLPGPNGTFAVNCVTVDPSDGTVYVGTPNGSGIYVSTDDGVTWTSKSSGLPVAGSVTAIAVTGSSVLAIADSIYESTDGGDTWATLPGAPVGMTNLHVTSGGTIYAGAEVGLGGQGIYRSTDGGANWTQTVNGLPSYTVFLTYYRSVSGITSDASGNVYCAVNGGSATTETGVYVSTDGGDNWTRSVTGLRQNSSVKPIGRGPNDLLYVDVDSFRFSPDSHVHLRLRHRIQRLGRGVRGHDQRALPRGEGGDRLDEDRLLPPSQQPEGGRGGGGDRHRFRGHS